MHPALLARALPVRGGLFTVLLGLFLLQWRRWRLGFGAWEGATGCPWVSRALDWSRQGWREVAWARGLRWPKGEAMGMWILAGGLAQRVGAGGHYALLALALGVRVSSPKRAAFKSHRCCPSPCASPGLCVAAAGSVCQGPDLPCWGKRRGLQKHRERSPCSLARLEPACFYWEHLGWARGVAEPATSPRAGATRHLLGLELWLWLCPFPACSHPGPASASELG